MQEQVVPARGRVVVSCPAPFGGGGLGRHLKEFVDAIDRRGERAICLCGVSRGTPSQSPTRHELCPHRMTSAIRPLLRFSPALGYLRHSIAFDICAERNLPEADHLIAFNGQALRQFAAASRAHYQSISLLSANSHMRQVVRRHAQAHRQYPLEGSWSTRLLRRNLKEYDQAQRIYVASRYTRESFLQEGFDEEMLPLFPFVPDPRFQPDGSAPRPGTFNVVFSGRLCVAKGVPLLIDAVRRLTHEDLRLVLVGGWNSRGMRRFLQEACARDKRVRIGPGDPLPHLRSASLCAHPSYEDGFGYAPAEAMACGVPALVSEDTGMKELIEPGVNGADPADGGFGGPHRGDRRRLPRRAVQALTGGPGVGACLCACQLARALP